MQTFLPYKSFKQSLQSLDYRRLGKQRVEAFQVLNVLLGRTKTGGWRNHPVTRMWAGYENALKEYLNKCIDHWIDRGYNNNMEIYDVNNMVKPHWIGNEAFHSSHRANLLRKDYEYYSQFGWKENPEAPYVWHDKEGLWYEQIVGTGKRLYI